MIDWNEAKPGRKPLGKMGPWVWTVEPVSGCNLKCWHCSARLLPDGEYKYMTKKVWEAMCRIVDEITPRVRMDLGQAGEPTLHPHLLDMLKSGRKLSPTTQFQVYTNGITLLQGKITLEQLFEAGAHIVYIDMYGPVSKFMELAKQSGAEWYRYYQSTSVGSENHRMANTYYGDPEMRLVVLQDTPEDRLRWRKVGRLSTLLNNLDWSVSVPYGLVPLRKPYARGCTIPMRFSSVDHRGNYLFCCLDFMWNSAELMGNVLDGVEGFKRYWFGPLMQSIRRRLFLKDRANIPYCSTCNCAFSKCDWTSLWGGQQAFERVWTEYGWKELFSLDSEEEAKIFAPGWSIIKRNNDNLPSEEEVKKMLEASGRKIINTVEIAKKYENKVCFGLKEEEK